MNKRVFLDTNILVYSKDEASPFFGHVCEALKGLVLNKVDLCINRQVLREYACVVTRPAPRGLSAGIERALKEISEFEAAYRVLEYPENVWQQWKRLVRTSGFTGLRLHDAYIGAVMVGHGIKYILTLNIKDFQDLQGIKPVKPEYWQKIT